MIEKVNGNFKSSVDGFNVDLSWTRDYSELPELISVNSNKIEVGKPTQYINGRYNFITGFWQLQNCENVDAPILSGLLDSFSVLAKQIKLDISEKITQIN